MRVRTILAALAAMAGAACLAPSAHADYYYHGGPRYYAEPHPGPRYPHYPHGYAYGYRPYYPPPPPAYYAPPVYRPPYYLGPAPVLRPPVVVVPAPGIYGY